MRMSLKVVALAVLVSPAFASTAIADCRDSDGANANCVDRVNEAIDRLKKSETVRDAARNAANVGRAAVDCVRCGTESALDRIQVNRESTLGIEPQR